MMKKLKAKLIPDRRVFADRQLQEALRPVIMRLRREHYLIALMRALAVALAGSLLLFILAFFRPWADVPTYCLAGAGVILLLALAWAVISRPGLWEAACQADAQGLKERVSTALELSGRPPGNELQTRQREDALNRLQALDMEASFPLRLPRREGKVLVALALFLIAANVIPNPQQGEVERQRAIRREIAQQQKQVEKVKNDLARKNEKSPSVRREEGIKALEDLEQELNRTKKQEQAMKSLTGTEEQLKKLAGEGQEDINHDLQKLSQALKQNEAGQEIGEKLAAGDSREIKTGFDRLAAKTAAMTAADKQKLAASLSQAAASMHDGGLQSQLNQAAQSLSSGSAQAAGSKLSALGATLGEMSAQSAVNTDLAQAQMALQSARTGIAAAAGSGNSASMAAAGSSNRQPGGNTPGGGNSPGGTGAGSGQGSQGQGAGQGAGAGAGAGIGSSNQDSQRQGNSSSGRPSGGNLPADMSVGEYEKIYDPARLGRAGETSYVKGQEGSGPQQTVEIDNPDIVPDSMLPYQQVIGEYSQAARESLNRSVIPAATQDLVRDYFSSLEEN
jgi:hypothetical protein